MFLDLGSLFVEHFVKLNQVACNLYKIRLKSVITLVRPFRIAWSVFAPTVTIELAGNMDKVGKGLDEYLAFGVSNPQGQSKMVGSDVSVAYMDGFQAIVEDYNITAKSLCTSVLNQVHILIQGGEGKFRGPPNFYQPPAAWA